MRLLKRKVEKATKRWEAKYGPSSPKYSKEFKEENTSDEDLNQEIEEISLLAQRNRVQGSPKSKYSNRCLKNVAKNYGRAICNFIISSIADPYIEDLQKQFSVEGKLFKMYIKEKKNLLDGIDSFRAMLLKTNEDSKEVLQYKSMFQKLCEIFIKYFSANWICSGKLTYKMEYLKFRHKMLRRVQNPELFTYIR
jgi:hypothetical protein